MTVVANKTTYCPRIVWLPEQSYHCFASTSNSTTTRSISSALQGSRPHKNKLPYINGSDWKICYYLPLAGTHNILHSTPPTLVLSASPMPYAEPNLPRIHVVEFKGFLGRFKYLANLRFEYAPVTAISTASQSSFYSPVVPCPGQIYSPGKEKKQQKINRLFSRDRIQEKSSINKEPSCESPT